MNGTVRVIGVLLAAGVAASACSTYKTPLVAQCASPAWWKNSARPGPALVGVPYGMQSTPIPLDSIQFSDDRVAGALSLQQLSARRTATGTVQVSARFVSCARTPMSVRMRTSFLGSGQSGIEPHSAWKTVFLQPHLMASYEELSTSREVENYVVEIVGN